MNKSKMNKSLSNDELLDVIRAVQRKQGKVKLFTDGGIIFYGRLDTITKNYIILPVYLTQLVKKALDDLDERKGEVISTRKSSSGFIWI